MAKIAGIDVGGTFTDAVVWDTVTRKLTVGKASSIPTDQSIGVLNALEVAGAPMKELELIVHGTTVGTNTILERKGARVAFITTKGFRDIIELRRRDRARLYGLHSSWEPLIPRFRRFEVDERTSAMGEILKEVPEDEVREVVRCIEGQGVKCIVIGFLNSYINPANERRAAEILRSCWDGYIVVSTDVVPGFREFERFSTSVTNAYIQPNVDGYLSKLEGRLKERGFKKNIAIVHSSGGIMSLEVARQFPVRTFLSGPSSGVAAAAYLGPAVGYKNVISCDMGGTSFDTAVIKDGHFGFIEAKDLRYGVPLQVPQIDMITIGAGGGSIAWIDKGGLLQVGPQSAGSDPGPVCYGRGGQEPTVTDANLVLCRIDKGRPLGRPGEIRLDVGLATKAIKEKIADRLGLSVKEAASVIIKAVNANMATSIRLVSVARGHDPREFVLMMFGGAGPLHGNSLMKELGVRTTIVPVHPGLFCALGCTVIPFQYAFVRTVNKRLVDINMEEMRTTFLEQESRAMASMKQTEEYIERIEVRYEAEMHYKMQTHYVPVPFPSAAVTREEIKKLFDLRYREDRGELVEGVPINIMNLRTIVTGFRPVVDPKDLTGDLGLSLGEAKRGSIKTYYDGGEINCDIFDRGKIPLGTVIPGPAILEELDATTFVEPDSIARVDNTGNIIITGSKW